MVTAIVLAAGLSARMGKENKLLLPFRGKTVIETVVQNLVNAGIGEIIVVTGHEAEMVKRTLVHLPVQIVYNPDYEKGMTTSIQLGVTMAEGDGYMICLSDMPMITAEEYLFLAESFERQKLLNQECISIPLFENKKGNPVIFSSFYKPAINHHFDMEGCREIIQSNRENVSWVDMKLANTLIDIDTIHDYEKLKVPISI